MVLCEELVLLPLQLCKSFEVVANLRTRETLSRFICVGFVN